MDGRGAPAGQDITGQLAGCFARYDGREIARGLRGTAELFARLARECAQRMQVPYPIEAEKYALEQFSVLTGQDRHEK